MKSVPLGKEARFRVQARTRENPKPNASGEVAFARGDTGQSVGGAKPVEVSDGLGVVAWTGDGLEEQELECVIHYTVTVADEVAGEGNLRVFRDKIKVIAKDKQGAVIKGACCRMTLNPHADVRTQYGITRERIVERTTDDRGEITFNILAGTTEFEWLPPYDALEWPKPDGTVREAKLEKSSYVVAFVTPNAGEHKQWVNELPDVADPLLGPKLKLVVKGHKPHEEGTRAGTTQKVYFKVSRSKTGSLRSDDSGPGLGQRPLTPGGSLTGEATLDAGHQAEFEVHLGHGGGDEFTIAIGSTPKCLDATLTVVTWRRVYLHSHFVQDPATIEMGPVEERVNSALDGSYIEAEFVDPVRVDASGGLMEVPMNEYAAMGLKRKPVDVVTVHQALFKETGPFVVTPTPEGCLSDVKIADGRARIYMLFVDLICWKREREVEISFRGSSTGWRSFPVGKQEGKWLPRYFDDPVDAPATASFLEEHNRIAKWAVSNGQREVAWGVVKAADIEVNAAKGKYRMRLHGDELGLTKKVTLKFKFYFLDGKGGSSSGSCISIGWSPEAHQVGHALAHELGHSLNQSALPSEMAAFPGVAKEHPATYTGHQHDGPHCAFGLSKSDAAKDDYNKLLAKGKHGTCVMWGGVGPKFDYAKAEKFCEHCMRFLAAKKVEAKA